VFGTACLAPDWDFAIEHFIFKRQNTKVAETSQRTLRKTSSGICDDDWALCHEYRCGLMCYCCGKLELIYGKSKDRTGRAKHQMTKPKRQKISKAAISGIGFTLASAST